MSPEHSISIGNKTIIKNVRSALDLIDQVIDQGPVDLAVLPEFVFTGPVSTLENLETMVEEKAEDDIGVRLLAQKAQEKNIYIIAPLFLREGGKYYNVCVLIDQGGKIAGKYFKVHLYPPEKALLSAGNVFKTFPVRITGQEETVGLQICYDLAFPEGCRVMALRGAKVIFYPTMCEDWMMDYFEPMARARAIENRVFIVLVNSVGAHPRTGGKLSGRSLVAAPGGQVTSLGEGQCVRRVYLDLSEVGQARAELNFLMDRNPQAYAELINLNTPI